jgi:hypothetical protein
MEKKSKANGFQTSNQFTKSTQADIAATLSHHCASANTTSYARSVGSKHIFWTS